MSESLASLSSCLDLFLREFNPTRSDQKLLDVNNHNAFNTLMLSFYQEIYTSLGRDHTKFEQIVGSLLQVFEIESGKISSNQGMREICDEVLKISRAKSFSINKAVEKLNEWKKMSLS
jgi:hypothetical protein